MVSWRLLIAMMLLWVGALQPVVAADARNLRVEGSSQRLALVIGNDSYRRVRTLDNARADARALASALEAAGFTVTLKLDVDQKAMKQALRAFKAQLAGGDEAVFYFSGHGVQLAGENYLLPIDIEGQNADQIRDDAVALQRVLDDLREQKTRFALAIIDACRDNPFKSTGKAIGGRGLAATTAATGQMVIYAAGTGQQALDRLNDQDKNPNGLFAREFLKEMNQPGVPVSQVLRKVRDEVVRLARTVGHEQVPALYDQAIGDFYFRPPENAAPASPAAGAPPAAASEAYPPGKVFRDCPACPQMVVVPAGEFTMGSPESEAGRDKDEGPQHRVRIGKAFALGRNEVTVGDFRRFVQASGYRTSAEKDAGKGCYAWDQSDKKWGWRAGRSWREPGYAQGEQQPVACVSWEDARAYGQWLAKETGKVYHLPSEAEWEYAARAGSTSAYPWGENPNDACTYANVADNTTFEGRRWSNRKHDCSDGYWFPAPVGSYQPNRFGLYDLIGNVWEWVQDCYQDSYAGAPADGSAREGGKCEARVLRGGGWDSGPGYARSAGRNGNRPGDRDDNLGFRLARTLP